MIGRTFHVGDIIVKLRDAIVAYEPLHTWCRTTYNKDLKFVVGADERNEQAHEDAPFIVLVPDMDSTGITATELTSMFSIDIGVLNPEFSDYNGIGAIEMKGLYELIEMADHVVNCIKDMALSCEMFVDDIDFQYNSGVFFPLHIGTMTGTIQTDHLLGDVQQTLGV